MKFISIKQSVNKNRSIAVFVIALFGFLVVNIAVAAWTPPSNDPPNSNTLEPLDVSNRSQTKQGNVGIGATASALHKLNVGGSINASTSLCINDNCYTDLNRLWNPTVNGIDMFNSSLGKVGIGLATPDAQLDITTGGQTVDSNILLRVSKRLANELTSEVMSVAGDGVTTVRQLHIHNIYGGLQEGWRQYQDEASGNFNLAYMYRDDRDLLKHKNIITVFPYNPFDGVSDPREGNIGINYTAPVEHLQVAGRDSEAGSIALSPGTSNSGYGFYRTGIIKFLSNDNESTDFWSGIEGYRSGFSDDTGLRFYTEANGDGAPSQKMTITGDGMVGIGKDPDSAMLDVNGSINAEGAVMAGSVSSDGDVTSTGGDVIANGKVVAGEFCINSSCTTSWNNNSYWTTATGGIHYSSGNVGIGTTNPLEKLYIQGNANATDIEWAAALKNPHNSDSGSYGVGLKLRNGAPSEPGKWSGIASVSESSWSNLTGLALYANATEKIRITNDGNVGIGTISPNSMLNVHGSSPFITLSNPASTAGTNLGKIIGRGSGYNFNGPQISFDIESNWNGGSYPTSMSFFTSTGPSSIERMRINSAGNVGIGTVNPGAKISILGGEGTYNVPNFGSSNLGSINIRNSTSDTRNAITFSSSGSSNAQAGIYVHQDNSAGTHMYLATTDSYATGPQARVAIRNNGNVGIGTTAPTTKLDVLYPSGARFQVEDYSGFPRLVGNGNWLFLGGTQVAGSFIPDSDISRSFGSDTRRFSAFYSKNLTDNGSNIGIGTTNPYVKLHVTGGRAAFGDSVNPGAVHVLGAERALNLISTDAVMRIVRVSANIDTAAPAFELGHVTSTSSNSYTAFWDTFLNSSGYSIRHRYDGSSWINSIRLNINNSGNVGVGTTGQTAKLQVNATTNTEGLRVISSNYSPFVIRNSSDSSDLLRVDQTGNATVAGTLSATKIDFAQADPPYKINNKTYATYALNMIGSKEEYSAILTLTKKSGEYTATINFENQDEGSDLWLFSKVTNLKKVFDKLIVQLTPNFSGKVWYEKVGNNKVIVRAVPDSTKNNNTLEVSLRLTAPRFDYEKWANTREPSEVANDLDEFYKNEQ